MERKTCPMCGEEISAAAKKCKHCGEYLERAADSGGAPTPSSVTGAGTIAPRTPMPSSVTGHETIFPEITPDIVLSGRYRIIREIGRGGMGVVYLAHDETLGIDVAVKVLPTVFAANERAIDALKAEARTAMKLSHPNIVRLYNFVDDARAKFLVMEYVDGESVDSHLHRKGVLSLKSTIALGSRIASALDYAHSEGVLHRDIKPGNIIIGGGRAKLTDFGIAREMHDTMTRLTGRETSGTLLYMSPEQLMGDKLDARADVYSFAATLYECLSGHPPFHTGDIPTQIMQKTPAPIAGIGAHVNNAIQMALSKDKACRPKSCAELVKLMANQFAIPDAMPVSRVEPSIVPPERLPHAGPTVTNTQWRYQTGQQQGIPLPVNRSGNAIAAMVLGICSITLCYLGVILGPLALVYASKGMAQVNMHGVRGRGMAMAGRITGIIGLIVGIIAIISVMVDAIKR